MPTMCVFFKGIIFEEDMIWCLLTHLRKYTLILLKLSQWSLSLLPFYKKESELFPIEWVMLSTVTLKLHHFILLLVWYYLWLKFKTTYKIVCGSVGMLVSHLLICSTLELNTGKHTFSDTNVQSTYSVLILLLWLHTT